MRLSALAAIAALAFAAPALAAPAPAPAPPPAPKLDDFACMVRTMYIAGAAENSAKQATDAESREGARSISVEAYETASYFIGRLTMTKGGNVSKARFDAEVASLATLQNTAVSDQIAECITRAKSERSAFIAPLSPK